MNLSEPILWTLNRLDSVQRSRFSGASHSPDPRHLEALEEAGYITVRAIQRGGWHIHVLPDGQEAAEVDRMSRAQHFQFQQKVQA